MPLRHELSMTHEDGRIRCKAFKYCAHIHEHPQFVGQTHPGAFTGTSVEKRV